MIELSPYRPPNSSLRFFRPLPKGSPFRWLSGPLVLIWFLIICFGVFFRSEPSFPITCLSFLLIPLGWGAILFTLNFAHKTLVDSRLGTPTVQASTNVIQRGDELRVVLEQPAKNQVALSSASIQLVRHEWVKYTSGTDTITLTHDEVIDEWASGPQTIEAGDTLHLETTFHIPDTAIHNFSYAHNRVQWLVAIHVDIRAWPDYYDRYDLEFPIQ